MYVRKLDHQFQTIVGSLYDTILIQRWPSLFRIFFIFVKNKNIAHIPFDNCLIMFPPFSFLEVIMVSLGTFFPELFCISMYMFMQTQKIKVPAYLRDIASSVPDHHNKVNIAIKQVTQIFWFPSSCKNYVYTMVYSIKCAIALCLK